MKRASGLRHSTVLLAIGVLLVTSAGARAQSTATLRGTVTDTTGAIVPNAAIVVRNMATAVERTTHSDDSGNYQVASLPVGLYRIEVRATGFQTQVVSDLKLEVGTTVVQNFQLQVGAIAQEVVITGEAPVIDTAGITVGQVINQKTVQEIPLNGRHFVDLGLLIPGTVTPPQNGFLTAPLRGQGSFAINTAGNREDTVNFMINGVNLNDMVQNQITFQPSINTVQEFKVDNSTFSAEYGRNSGAIANIATRSGTNDFHGEVFEFLRNDVLDARNAFAGAKKGPFKRNQFGGAVGGPIKKDRAFFFFSYEGLRQRQGLTINSGVLSDAQRAQALASGNPTVVKLVPLIPPANAIVNNAPRFLGAGTAPVNIDQWTGDVSVILGKNDRLHGYYAGQRDARGEPTLQGNTIPGFGDTRASRRQIFTLNETHTFGAHVVNEFRFGFNRIHITFTPNVLDNPTDFGINNGITTPIGLPQINITSIGLNFGGPAGFPQGRGDTTAVFADTISYQHGHHALKLGGEVRRFYNDNFNFNIGTFNFATVNDFINGNANSFTVQLGSVQSSIANGALGLFIQDSWKVRADLTFELGLRYDWLMSPSEKYDRFVVFDPVTDSLVRVGSGNRQLYHTSNKNFQPRFGFAWNPFGNDKTVVRGAYAILLDQPVTNMAADTTSNPPLATPLVFTGPIGFSNAVTVAKGAGLAPITVNPDFNPGYVQSWNLNIQREVTPSIGVMIGYFGSKGTHLRDPRNINQFVHGVRPFPKLSAASPILPGATLGNIGEWESGSNSSYNALWITANKRFSRGLQFNASYSWSKSIDDNSLSSVAALGVFLPQNSNNVRGDRGLSDFDARHRFVINWLYDLPFKGNRLVEGWQLSAITQLQSGNPISIQTNLSALTGVVNVGRPDVIGPIQTIGNPNQWFTNTVCNPNVGCPAGAVFAIPVGPGNVFHFGNLGRNVVIGPGFSNTDFSILKTTRITERVSWQFRAEFFDIFNHANFGQPGRFAAVGSPAFGFISSTRFPTGDFGSSRQVQFAMKLLF